MTLQSNAPSRPSRYPLPWCDAFDAPYWEINFSLCLTRPGWSRWQSGRPMSGVIRRIDRLVAAQRRLLDRNELRTEKPA